MRVIRSCLLVTALALVLAAAPAQPQGSEPIHEFDLPAGSLASTLIEIAQRTDVIVSFRPELVDRRMAPPIRGRLTLLQALQQAVQPSGLAVEIAAGGAVSIVPDTRVMPRVPDAAASAPVAAGSAGVIGVLPRVEIFGSPRRSDGLRAMRGWSAARTDVPLADLPQQVSVLTNEALALQGASNSIDSTRYIPGVVLTRGIVFGSYGPGGDDGQILNGVRVRGLNGSVALSGMRTVRNLLPIDNAFIDHIEVVKGPTGVLSGVSDYGGRGGQVNLVRKQAGPDAHTQVLQSITSQDGGTLRLSADLGGEWGARTHWRLISHASQSGRTEGGYTHQGGTGLLGSISHRNGDFTAGLTLQVDRQRIAPAPASRGGIQQPDGSFTPVERGLTVPLDAGDRALVSSADLEVDLAWRMAPSSRVTWKARLEAVENDSRRHQTGRSPALRQIDPSDAAMQAGLEHTQATGPAKHQLFVGLDLERWRFVEVYRALEQGDLTVVNHEYRQALLLQDLMSVGPWRVRLAVQRGRIPERVRAGFQDRVSEVLPATNWDAGLLYRWSPATAIYAGTQYGIETDNRRAGLMLDDGSEPPLTMLRQTQLGLKSELLNGHLALTFEAFRMRETNRLLGTPGVSLVSVPGTSVDGAEFELAGRPTPALDLNLGLALMTGTSQGDKPLGWVPVRSLQVLARYRLPEQAGPNASIGLAVLANSSTRLYALSGVDRGQFLRLPGGAKIDLSLERTFGPWTLNASVNNLFDRQFYGTVADQVSIPVLPGRSAALTATFRD